MSKGLKTKPSVGYFERHRIIPGCMGGKYINHNITWLTPEEHYVAHQLLVKIYPDNKSLIFAAKMMTTKSAGRKNKLYGWLKRKTSEIMMGNKLGQKNKGKSRPDVKIYMSKVHKGKIISEDHKKAISEKLKGRKRTPMTLEQISKLSQASKNIPKLECIHCGKKSSIGNAKRLHFENCKVIKNV
jgi:hypothetical protein